MKKWTKPQATMECFEANEVIAACWTIHCDVPGDNEKVADAFPKGDTNMHQKALCGNPERFEVHTDENGAPTEIIHIGGATRGPVYIMNGVDLSQVTGDTFIVFETRKGDLTWHHYGTLSGANHS